MTGTWGHLRPPSWAPVLGERVEHVARIGNVVIEHVVSGRLPAPVHYDQDHDEWAVVLSGAAVVEVDGASRDLGAGDWVLLPAHVPHRLVETRPGTVWLTLHGPADAPGPRP
jgi:cupin 2 domain-containing protein